MKALVMESYKSLTYKEVDKPQISKPTDVLVKVRAVAICGSDVHGYDGSTGRRIPPVIMGHEASGDIVAIGPDVEKFKVGDRVTFDSTIYCGKCDYCVSGRVNLCVNRRVLGVSCDEYKQDGAFAEFVVVPQHIIYKLPDEISYIEGSLTEPASVAAHAFNITPVKLNDSIAVVGAGLIGLLLIQILRVSTSGTIVAFDLSENRRKMALQMGADYAFDPTTFSLKESPFKPFDRVFEAVGATNPIKTATSIVASGGSITLIGNVSPTIELSLQQIVTREITLYGSCAINGEYKRVLDLMGKKKIDVMSLVSEVAPLSEGESWFNRLYNKEEGLLKVVLEP
ncbi:MAG: alcohol dehydrogenase catalytic domain-containing protein [Sphaerochaetaceae bacterium]|jgi:L-iditol 2-dehydrogenase